MLEGGGGGGGEKRRGGGRRHSGGREIHYHDNGFSDWLTCRCWPAMPAACLPAWQGRKGTRREGRERQGTISSLPPLFCHCITRGATLPIMSVGSLSVAAAPGVAQIGCTIMCCSGGQDRIAGRPRPPARPYRPLDTCANGCQSVSNLPLRRAKAADPPSERPSDASTLLPSPN